MLTYASLGVHSNVAPRITAVTATANAVDTIATMSADVVHSTSNAATVDEELSSSRLLRYNNLLGQTSTLPSATHDVLPYVVVNQCEQFTLSPKPPSCPIEPHRESQNHILEHTELSFQYDSNKQGRILETDCFRHMLQEGLAASDSLISKLLLKGDKLKSLRVRLMQRWGRSQRKGDMTFMTDFG